MQDAKANEVDSGTELEEDEIEEIGGVEEKEEGEKKDDWEERDGRDQKKPHSLVNDQWSHRHYIGVKLASVKGGQNYTLNWKVSNRRKQ